MIYTQRMISIVAENLLRWVIFNAPDANLIVLL